MSLQKLKRFLDDQDIRYVVINHSPAYTAQQIAAAAHIPGRELAKIVMVKADGELVMAVVVATSKVSLILLKETTGAERVEVAHEDEFSGVFPDCELGAMPPFGNLYGLKVYVDRALAEDEQIAFNAGTHTQLIQMAYRDFEATVRPSVTRLAAAVAV